MVILRKEKQYTLIADIRGFQPDKQGRIYTSKESLTQPLSFGTNFFVFKSSSTRSDVNIDLLGDNTKLKNVEVGKVILERVLTKMCSM